MDRGKYLEMRRTGVAATVLLWVLAACSASGPDRSSSFERSDLTPIFQPTSTAVASPLVEQRGDIAASTSTAPTGATASTERTGTTGAATTPAPYGSLADPAGDLSASTADPPPEWADLRGATLTRLGYELELEIELNAAVPAHAPDDERTMNVASFYDLDGDGRVDVEVWVTLADNGWGGAHFDNRSRSAEFAAASEVRAMVEHGRLVVRFPASHLDEASAFRWSIASEWGRFETIGTGLAARDDAPGHNESVTFPG